MPVTPTALSTAKDFTISSAAPNSRQISAAIKPLHLFFLYLCTLGLYSSFYLFHNARDLKQLDKKPIQPWLWFFAPFVSFALIFALYFMMQRYQNLAAEKELKFSNLGALYGSLLFLVGIVAMVNNLISPESALIIRVAIAVLSSALFAAFGVNICKFKNQLADEELAAGSNQMTGTHWLVIAVGSCASIAFLSLGSLHSEALSADSRATKSQQTANHGQLAAGRLWQSADQSYSFESRYSWQLPPVGTHSDGSADVEFSLPGDEFALVFSDQGGDVDDVAAGRRVDIIEAVPNAQCREKHWLLPNSLTLVAQMRCEGEEEGDKVVYLIVQQTDGETHIEVYAYARGSDSEVQQAETKLLELSHSLQLGSDGEAP